MFAFKVTTWSNTAHAAALNASDYCSVSTAVNRTHRINSIKVTEK